MRAAVLDARLPGWLRAFPGAVLQLAPDGTVLESNGRLDALLGASLVGRGFAEALDAESSRAKWTRALGAATAGAESVTAELVLRAGETLEEPLAFSVLWDAQAQVVWLVEHPRDPRLDGLREQVTEVNSELANTQRALLKERGRLAHALDELRTKHTELEATSAELARSNRALDEFARAVSHDLKTPLRAIANYAQWAADDGGDALPAESRAHLTSLEGQVRRMRAMVDGVLAYARAGREDAPPETVALPALARHVVALVEPPPTVTVSVDEAMPTIVSARAPLQQVLLNLIDNAVKHAGRNGGAARVRVAARLDGEWCEVSVSDDGPGIPPAQQVRIWQLFHTLQSGSDDSGIGLAVVRRLVEAQGGRVWVTSSAGSGATFTFQWPTRPEETSGG